MTGPIDPVSTFLSIVEPWSTNTYVNIEAYTWEPAPNGDPSKGEGDLSRRQGSRAARTVAEAAQYIRWQNGLGKEVYVRMAGHGQPGIAKTDKRGRTYFTALGGKANAKFQQSFFIDVDVKAGGHGSTAEAKDAVIAMCVALGLPLPSLVVYSGGGGFHAHWVLDAPLPTADWLPLARALSRACKAHNIHADDNLTVNPVCLLRIPGTHNRKYGAPRDVTMEVIGPAINVAIISQVLGPYVLPENLGGTPNGTPGNDPWPLHLFPARTVRPLAEAWHDGISSGVLTLEEVAEGCPLVKATLKTGGKGQEQPLWFMMGHVPLFTVDGLKDYHRLSDGHDLYEPDKTDQKYAEILKAKDEQDLGWPRCATFEQNGSPYCAACPNRGLGKSPLNFAVRAVTPPSNPQEPGDSGDKSYVPPPRAMFHVDGYHDDLATGIYSRMVTKMVNNKPKEVEEIVNDFPIWNLDYLRGADGRMAMHFDTTMAKVENIHVTLQTEALRNSDTLRGSLLGQYGLPIIPGSEKGFLTFMASFKSQMRRTRDVIVRQELMGWSEIGGTPGGNPVGFIYGPSKFTKTGAEPFFQPDSMIREQYFPTGSPDPWLKAIKMINAEKRPEMDLLVATAFAAPLMRFTGEKGVVVSAFSSATAAHKTTAIKIGQAVWGAFKGINQLTDTLNSVIARTGKTRVVPTYYDEMKSSTDIKRFASMIYTFAGGRGKGRLNRNAEIKDVDTWDTLLVGVSNDSLFDHMAHLDKGTDAGVARIFEFEIMRPDPNSPGQISMGEAGALLKKLEHNYGHAGLKYAEHLGKSVDTLPGEITQRVSQLQKELKAEDADRFWVSAAAVLMVGAEQANKIGLTNFDIPKMRTFIGEIYTRMRGAKAAGDMDISNKETLKAALANYLNTHRRSIYATDTKGLSASAGGAVSSVTVLNHADIAGYTDKFTVRYIKDTNTLRISISALKDWLSEKQLSPGVFMKNLVTLLGGKIVGPTNLLPYGKGDAPERLIELDLNLSDLAGLYEI